MRVLEDLIVHEIKQNVFTGKIENLHYTKTIDELCRYNIK